MGEKWLKCLIVVVAVSLAAGALSSCQAMHRTFSKKAVITFDANGGIVTGSGVDTGGKSDPAVYEAKCIVGDALTGFTASRDYYDFLGWFTDKDGGNKVSKGPKSDAVLYAHWESSNKDRTVEISNVSAVTAGESAVTDDEKTDEEDQPEGAGDKDDTGSDNQSEEDKGKDENGGSDDNDSDEPGIPMSKPEQSFYASMLRISADDDDNEVTVSFTISKWFGQDIAFVNKKGKLKENIEISGMAEIPAAGKDADPAESLKFSDEPVTITCPLPDKKWMDYKEYSYYIKSLGNDHVDESDVTELKIVLDGQYVDFDKPIEGSMVWYGGTEASPADRTGMVLATDDDYVYAISAGGDVFDGDDAADSSIYKWKKSDVMINLADVRTDIVYDIYNAYSSRFYPIEGKALYSDNGGKGLKRYDAVKKDDAMHKNRKTGKTTFMVPVQWDFAETVASVQAKARNMGVTLYIVDSFRPMDSVGPVVKAVDNYALLAPGGTSAHNFGMAVDTGWQLADEKGKPVGEPFDKNLQVLNKKKAVRGPRGNDREIWWEGVNKLPQEWWHYGDSLLQAGYREHAKRVAKLYVNQGDCASMKRSKL